MLKGLLVVLMFFSIPTLTAYLMIWLRNRKLNHIQEAFVDEKPAEEKLVENKPAQEKPTEFKSAKTDSVPIEVAWNSDSIQVLTPSDRCDWQYDKEKSTFVFGPFSINVSGTICIGPVDTGIANKILYNKLIQKLAVATIKNKYMIPAECYYKEPVKPKKEKKKA